MHAHACPRVQFTELLHSIYRRHPNVVVPMMDPTLTLPYNPQPLMMDTLPYPDPTLQPPTVKQQTLTHPRGHSSPSFSAPSTAATTPMPCPCMPMRARACPRVLMRAHACPCLPIRCPCVQFTELLRSIYRRHSNVVPMMAKGVAQLRLEMQKQARPTEMPEIHQVGVAWSISQS
jgi:hypothetical protein